MRVAFIAPFFGADAAGGAESECRNTAIRLASAGVETEIYTTCALDLQHDWNVNCHRRGAADQDGLKIHRFRTEQVNLSAFGRLNQKLLAGETLEAAEELQFMAMHVNSTGLCRGLADAAAEYDWLCFIPYLFGTTYFGSMICPEKSILIPCLHDEQYARMYIVARLFERVARVVFHTKAELDLALELYDIPDEKCLLIGEGIETVFASDGERFKQKYGINFSFILYAGRKDETKNVHKLIEYMTELKRYECTDVRLIMIGPGRMRIPPEMSEQIIDLGFIPEQDKKDAYSAATVFCQPSLNESFSIVIMEAWMCGIPCLVHGDCAVTREHVISSGGGLYFSNGAEFKGCLEYLLNNRDESRRMGEAGRDYVQRNFAWSRIIDRYQREVFIPKQYSPLKS